MFVRRPKATVAAGILLIAMASQAQAAPNIDLFETGDSTSDLVNALLAPSSGISVVGGSTNYVGRTGNGTDPYSAQSGTYTGFNEVPNNPGLPTITNPDGVVLTSGTANIISNNSAGDYSTTTGSGSDADLSSTLTNAAAPSSIVSDVNSLEFTFTVDDPTNNAVTARFVFASDEFPDQSVTDVFGFYIDGVNYAFFPDGSLVSFVEGANAANFNDNDFGTDNYNIEFDGISNSLTITGLLDPTRETHTLKIAIGDTQDSAWDSAVFIGGLQAVRANTGGVNQPPTAVSEPGTLGLLAIAFTAAGFFARRRRG